MVAAAEGHALTMRILLENHAVVNDTDKLKVSHLLSFIFGVGVTPLANSLHRGLQARIQDFGKGGRGAWVINWQCAHRRCAPLGGLKACPLGTVEILDAFSCNLVHILSKNYI